MSDTLRANQECLRQILWYSMLSNLVSLVNRLTLMLLRLRGNGLILIEFKIRIFHRLRFHPLQLFFFHFYTLIIHMPVDHHIIIKLILLAAVYAINWLGILNIKLILLLAMIAIPQIFSWLLRLFRVWWLHIFFNIHWFLLTYLSRCLFIGFINN